MPSKPKIEIREIWCKGCGFCVATCPQDVLGMDDAKLVVEKPEGCTGCELCVWICPDFAIKITKEANHSRSPAED